jgi:hypothetical protein
VSAPRPHLDPTDPAAVATWLADLRLAFTDADAVIRAALRRPRRRELGPVLARATPPGVVPRCRAEGPSRVPAASPAGGRGNALALRHGRGPRPARASARPRGSLAAHRPGAGAGTCGRKLVFRRKSSMLVKIAQRAPFLRFDHRQSRMQPIFAQGRVAFVHAGTVSGSRSAKDAGGRHVLAQCRPTLRPERRPCAGSAKKAQG